MGKEVLTMQYFPLSPTAEHKNPQVPYCTAQVLSFLYAWQKMVTKVH